MCILNRCPTSGPHLRTLKPHIIIIIGPRRLSPSTGLQHYSWRKEPESDARSVTCSPRHGLIHTGPWSTRHTPVSRFGLATAGKRKDLGSNLLRFSFLFKSCGLWALSCDFVHHHETLKWLSTAAHLNAGIILVVIV